MFDSDSEGSLDMLRQNVDKVFTFSGEELERILTKEELIKLCKHKKCRVALEVFNPIHDIHEKLKKKRKYQNESPWKMQMKLLRLANKKKTYATRALSEEELIFKRKFNWEMRKVFNVRWLNKIANSQALSNDKEKEVVKSNISNDIEEDYDDESETTQSEFLGFLELQSELNQNPFKEINIANYKDSLQNEIADPNMPKNPISKGSELDFFNENGPTKVYKHKKSKIPNTLYKNHVLKEMEKNYSPCKRKKLEIEQADKQKNISHLSFDKKVIEEIRIPLKKRKVSYLQCSEGNNINSEDPLRYVDENDDDTRNDSPKCMTENSQSLKVNDDSDSELNSELSSESEISLFANNEDILEFQGSSQEESASKTVKNEYVGLLKMIPQDGVSNSTLKPKNMSVVENPAQINHKNIPIILLLDDNRVDYGYFVRCNNLFFTEQEGLILPSNGESVDEGSAFENSMFIEGESLNNLIVAKVESLERDAIIELRNSGSHITESQNRSFNQVIVHGNTATTGITLSETIDPVQGLKKTAVEDNAFAENQDGIGQQQSHIESPALRESSNCLSVDMPNWVDIINDVLNAISR